MVEIVTHAAANSQLYEVGLRNLSILLLPFT